MHDQKQISNLIMKNRKFHFALFLLCTSLLYFPLLKGQSQDALNEVKELIENFQFNDAIKAADRFLYNDSSNVQMHLYKSRALSACFKFREANTILIKALLLDSTSIPVLFDLVNNYRQLGNTCEAVDVCKKIIQLDPGNQFFIIHLSNIYYNTDEFDKAKELLVSLVRLDSLNPFILKQLGNCYTELNQPDSAISFFRKVLERNPSDPGTTGKLINLYIITREVQKGLELSENYLIRDSVNDGILRLNGYCHYLLKNYPEAERKFMKCSDLGDGSKFVKKYLGLCYYKQDSFYKAEPLFGQAFRMDTTDAEVCFYYGVSAHRSMLLDTGLIYLNKTLTLLMPSDQFLSTLYIELSAAYTMANQPDTAVGILKKAYETFPDNKKLLFKIAYQYDYYLQQPEKALPYYKDFLRNSSEPDQEVTNLPMHVSYHDYTKKRINQIISKP